MTMLSIKFDSCVQQLLLWIGKLPVPVRDTSVCDTGSHVEHDNGTLALNAVTSKEVSSRVSCNKYSIRFHRCYIYSERALTSSHLLVLRISPVRRCPRH